MRFSTLCDLPGRSIVLALFLSFSPVLAAPALAEATGFTQSLATAAASDDAMAAWYRKTGYKTLWTGAADAARRGAFLVAIASAPDHGLPVQRYDATALRAAFAAAETEADRGLVEVAMTRAYLAWAGDLTSGALEPKVVDAGIVREIAKIDPQVLLARIAGGDPEAVLANLLPKSQVYLQLMTAKFRLERQVVAEGWGAPLAVAPLAPGDSGAAVVALRDRLFAMGYLAASAGRTYDRVIQAGVREFQLDHGLVADGTAAESTILEINISPEQRLKSVIVALERERWMDIDRSARHIWVNLPDFTAKIIDAGQTVFQTRAVVGKSVPDQQTPEFSDQMEHMVINPSWGVPRSIIVKEYLPLLQRNPNAVGHLQVVDRRGRVVPRGAVNFAAYNARNFPFALRQPPSDDNALGLVKFMFPNPYNIYLHDTPSKSLFDNEVRAYSHGCIRLADPFDFAYALLAAQSTTPVAEFARDLKTGKETLVKLNATVPVHLVYFTAYPTEKGKISYRRDIYGRDAALYQALAEAGVALGGVQG